MECSLEWIFYECLKAAAGFKRNSTLKCFQLCYVTFFYYFFKNDFWSPSLHALGCLAYISVEPGTCCWTRKHYIQSSAVIRASYTFVFHIRGTCLLSVAIDFFFFFCRGVCTGIDILEIVKGIFFRAPKVLELFSLHFLSNTSWKLFKIIWQAFCGGLPWTWQTPSFGNNTVELMYCRWRGSQSALIYCHAILEMLGTSLHDCLDCYFYTSH